MDAIVGEVVRSGRIVSNLKVFSRCGSQRLSLFSLGELLDVILEQAVHQIALERYRIIRYWQRISMG